jgi:hypothetical protein
MTIPIRGQFGEDLTTAVRDALAPVEVVKLAHVFGTASAVVTALNVGDVVIKSWFQVTTAYNAGTTNVITAGNTASASKFLAAADITEATPAVYPATDALPPGTAETVASNLVLAYAQTGTAATTGAGTFYATIARASVLDTDTAS